MKDLNNELISIVVPVYNAEKYLKRCLESIINQTYKSIEIICVNDGSTDNSLKILREYESIDSRIIVIDKTNQGVSKARNEALKQSKGAYITFVDSDDWIELDMIETLYNTLIEKNVDVVRGNYINNYNCECGVKNKGLNGLENQLLYTNEIDFSKIVISKFLNGKLPCYIVLLMIKRDCIFEKNLKFKEDICLMEDTIFYIELLNNVNSIYFLDKPLYHYYLNVNSCTNSNIFYIRNIDNLVKVNNYLTDIIKKSKFKVEVDIIESNIARIILDHFYRIYKSFDEKQKDAKELIEQLLEKEEMHDLLSRAKLSNVKFYIRVTRNLLLKKSYKKLFFIYNLRNYFSIIKHKIK